MKSKLLSQKFLGYSIMVAFAAYLFFTTQNWEISPWCGLIFLPLGIGICWIAGKKYRFSFRRIWCMLADRLCGCKSLATLIFSYLMCDIINYTYSPIRTQLSSIYFTVTGGIILWVAILFYADNIDRLDNLLMAFVFSGILLAGIAVMGEVSKDPATAFRIIVCAMGCAIFFFLFAQYSRGVKGVIVASALVFMIPSALCSVGWAASTSAVQLSFASSRDVADAFIQFRQFSTPQLILGMGSGYDLTLTQLRGVCNFLLSDLLSGGLVRFILSLILWLYIAYSIGMLFLYQKKIAPLYFVIFTIVFINAFAFAKTGFMGDPVFWIFSIFLILERTQIQKGCLRFQ